MLYQFLLESKCTENGFYSHRFILFPANLAQFPANSPPVLYQHDRRGMRYPHAALTALLCPSAPRQQAAHAWGVRESPCGMPHAATPRRSPSRLRLLHPGGVRSKVVPSRSGISLQSCSMSRDVSRQHRYHHHRRTPPSATFSLRLNPAPFVCRPPARPPAHRPHPLSPRWHPARMSLSLDSPTVPRVSSVGGTVSPRVRGRGDCSSISDMESYSLLTLPTSSGGFLFCESRVIWVSV